MSEYDKKKLYNITHRLYKELRNDPEIIIKKLRQMCGFYDYSTNQIALDYRKELIPTLIHEYLHRWYPDASETWVLQEESKIVNSLTEKQVVKILVEFTAAISTRHQ